MAATASYNQATKVITVESDGLPAPVSFGTFPNDNNPNTVVEQDFDHDFIYRGGTFGIARTFDNNGYTHDGFVRRVTISANDLTLFTGGNPDIAVEDNIFVNFSDGLKQKFVFKSTTFTSIDGECWLSSDTTLDFIVEEQATTPVSGTYEYYDQRNGRVSTPLGNIGIAGNGVAIFNPSAGAGLNPPSGFSWVAAGDLPFVNSGEDSCGGHPEQGGQYHYHDPHFLDCWKSGGSIASYNDYYGATQYNGNNIRHPDGHSKIIGIAYDGFPIYGPYGYSTPFDNLSGTRTMRTSYAVRDSEVAGRPDYGSTTDNPPAGTLMEDYEYIEGTGDLDSHNGRFAITPEYQDGTYAYFLTVDENNVDNTKFPYIIGLTTRETIDTTFTVEPVQQGGGGDQGGGDGGVVPILSFTLQPASVSVNSGQTATFTVQKLVSPEDGPVSFQWYKSTDGGFAFSAVTGATTNTLAVTALPYMTGYKYRCRIIGPIGGTTASNSPLDSQAATLTVLGGGGSGSTANRFDSTSSTLDSTLQTYDGT